MESIVSAPFRHLAARVALPLLTKSKTYQPVYLGGKRIRDGARESDLRWEYIEKVIRQDNIGSVLDLGCAEGFFVRKAVEAGCFATGADMDSDKLVWAQTTMTLDGLQGFGFFKQELTPQSLTRLPPADMLINLSLVHHLMYGQGLDYARSFMASARALTRKVMIFEMGQSNERHYDWASKLPDMGADPHAWIKQFLLDCGFSRVELLCKVRSHKDVAERAVFAAYV